RVVPRAREARAEGVGLLAYVVGSDLHRVTRGLRAGRSDPRVRRLRALEIGARRALGRRRVHRAGGFGRRRVALRRGTRGRLRRQRRRGERCGQLAIEGQLRLGARRGLVPARGALRRAPQRGGRAQRQAPREGARGERPAQHREETDEEQNRAEPPLALPRDDFDPTPRRRHIVSGALTPSTSSPFLTTWPTAAQRPKPARVRPRPSGTTRYAL